MKYCYNDFCKYVKTVLEFREEWDSDQWNDQFINFHYWLQGINSDYAHSKFPTELYVEFAKEYYQDATPETHDYWLTPN